MLPLNPIAAMDNGFVVLLVMMCLVMLSVSMLRRSQQRLATRKDLTRESLARLRDTKDVRVSMDDLLVQLEELSRRINAQVDTRYAKLETVIRDADARIQELTQLVQGTTGASPKLANGSDDTASYAPQHSDSTSPDSNDREARFQRIYELADAGTPQMTIADMLEIPVGEVELILSLRKYR